MGRDCAYRLLLYLITISIHAPRMGRDFTPHMAGQRAAGISIHAPRMGRDVRRVELGARKYGYFNPRAPYGARPQLPWRAIKRFEFQSTRPVWGATRSSVCTPRLARHFNPRAPYGARLPGPGFFPRPTRFQSTRPVWGATLCKKMLVRKA